MYKFAAAIAVLFSLYGCATTVDPAKVELFEKTIPTCEAGPSCDIKWAAARTFILNNSKIRFQLVSNDYMVTYNPPQSSTDLAFSANKEPIGNNFYSIRVNAWCDNPYLCVPNAIDTMLSFNRAVGSVK